MPMISSVLATALLLIDQSFTAQTTPPNFGFPAGADIAGGVLNVTKAMNNYTTAIKTFDTAITQQRTLDLAFDWKTQISAAGNKTGLEFRDSQGNLVFALAGTTTELRYGVTGPASDSTTAPESLSPVWTKVGYDRSRWYTVDLHLDFALQRVQYLIATKETAARVLASGTAPVSGKNLAKFVACNYYGTGVQSIDNFRLSALSKAINGQLRGKTMYAFGDSIVQGHTYSRSFVNLLAERELITLSKYAVNGASIGPSSKQIITQVRNAPTRSPDYVVFNGGTNDAENITNGQYGVSTYASSLETTLAAMRSKWPTARIVYVAVHKLGSRDWNTQLAIRSATLQTSARWNVTVADVFNDAALDTRSDSQRVAYTFNSLVNGFPGTGGTGTHPNLAGITKFYVPILTAALAPPQ
ncbi:SGNH/GDSL hydrolase family protein [Kribbella sp. NPDC005582]|uniref:SGNH/GDSL hydrolase family protein n=1 Tax=Kribbella sp. NPDC005582 TaxID=3156893 RepID=UPI0033A745FA